MMGGTMGENGPNTTEHHDHDPRRRISRGDTTILLQGLERLRECIEQRLKGLETLARERTGRPNPPASELEQRLQQTIAEYEEAQLRLRAQAERREQEWRTSLEQLEADRRLLAEAWERLERERVEGFAAAQPGVPGRTASPQHPAAVARPRPDPADAAGDHVAHAVLMQFHTLRNDVRRNSRHRGSR
jgi:hypothetical protein